MNILRAIHGAAIWLGVTPRRVDVGDRVRIEARWSGFDGRCATVREIMVGRVRVELDDGSMLVLFAGEAVKA